MKPIGKREGRKKKRRGGGRRGGMKDPKEKKGAADGKENGGEGEMTYGTPS